MENGTKAEIHNGVQTKALERTAYSGKDMLKDPLRDADPELFGIIHKVFRRIFDLRTIVINESF